jgi:hypothetical protein
MPITWGDFAGDGLANNWAIYTHPQGRMECFQRHYVNDVMATVTAVTYLSTIFFEQGQIVTNLGCYIGSTAAGTPTSSWLGIWAHPNFPPISMSTGGILAWRWQFNTVRTLTTATMNAGSGVTYPFSLVGRAITGTGVGSGNWIRSQNSGTQIVTNSGTGVTAGTNIMTVGQFQASKTALAWTTNGATAAIPANAAYTRPITPAPYIIPAAGLYMLGVTIAATTMPTLCAKTATAAVPVAMFNDAPVMSQSFVSGTSQNTAPGINPITGGTSADLRTIPYLFAT